MLKKLNSGNTAKIDILDKPESVSEFYLWILFFAILLLNVSILGALSWVVKQNLIKPVSQITASLTQTSEGVSTASENVAEASRETSKIINTIDEITFQTNLLVLNTAGESGLLSSSF